MLFARPSVQEPIGLVAGMGEFPVLFAKAAQALKRSVTVFGVKGLTDKRVEQFTDEAHYLELGELGRLIELLKEKKIKQVVFAGGVPKKQIYNPSLKMDTAATDFLGHVQNKGDDHILRALEALLKIKCGVHILDTRAYLKDLLAPQGVLTQRAPTEAEWRDLKLGFKMAKHIGRMDVGQTVIVKDGVVLAVEALEGTDQAIRRGSELGNGRIVAVKVSKPGQALRFDLPCVGLETLHTLKSAGSFVLGIEKDKTLMIARDHMIAEADAAGISMVGL